MNEKVKDIGNNIKAFWDKYNKKQKTIIVTGFIMLVLIIALIVWFFSKPKWEILKTCSNYNQVSEVKALLTENGIKHTVDDDALTVRVEKENLTNAKILLGSNDIQAEGYSLDDALSGSFSTTEGDKLKKYKAYLESKLAQELAEFDSIKKAHVSIKIPESSSILTSEDKETSVAVILVLKGELPDGMGLTLAQHLKTVVGNKTTEKISIIASTGHTIYSGEDSSFNTVTGSLATQNKYAQQINDTIAGSIKKSLLKLPMYDDVQIALNLDIDYDEVQEIVHKYQAQDGREEGLFKESYESTATGNTGVGGVPGTESNDSDTTYYIQNADGSYSEQKVVKYSYQPDEFITTTNKRPGDIIKDNSSISIILHDNVIYTYEDVKAAGHLKDMTWKEFKVKYGSHKPLEVDPQIVKMVAYGTGIDEENVSVLAYSVPHFVDKEAATSNSSFWVRIVLIAAIVLLLAIILFRSLSPVTVKETEPELSVEEMLASTRENQGNVVEDIDLQEKSEVRLAIDKFVDENPEAVALLLRNWLDEGWD